MESNSFAYVLYLVAGATERSNRLFAAIKYWNCVPQNKVNSDQQRINFELQFT